MQLKNQSLNFSETNKFLNTIVLDSVQHAKFLNTLSFMEHIGSRKIMLSQNFSTVTDNILQHLSEEARHASFFKRQAENIAQKKLFYTKEDLFAMHSSVRFFARLDSAITNFLKQSQEHRGLLPYYYVTCTIELRAEEFYEIYDAVLAKNSFDFRLRGILTEEKAHLQEMLFELQKMDKNFLLRLKIFQDFESKLFTNWLSNIEKQRVHNNIYNISGTLSV